LTIAAHFSEFSMRVPFNQIFDTSGGTIRPLCVVSLAGVTLSPGVALSPAVSFGGINLATHIGMDLEVQERPDGTLIITAFYK
jgi:hypothetical protein